MYEITRESSLKWTMALLHLMDYFFFHVLDGWILSRQILLSVWGCFIWIQNNNIRSLSVLTFTAFHWRKPFPTINSPTLFCLSLEESIDGFVRSVANCQNHLLRKQNMVIIQYKSQAEQEFYSMCVNATENKLSDL